MSNRICRNFASTGYCKFGQKCRFVHSTEVCPSDDNTPASPVASTSTATHSNRRQSTLWKSKQPCRFYLQGNCRRGDECDWSHEFKAEDLIKKEANTTVQRIILGASALVTCGAGLQVQHLVCGFDCLYITIKNLPQDTDRAEVEELFTQQGVDAASFFVDRMRFLTDRKEARIIIEAEIGETLAVGLDGTEFRDDEILDIAVDHDSGPSRMGTSGRNANTLTVTWKAPTAAQISFSYSLQDFDFDKKPIERDLRLHVERRALIESFEVTPPSPNKPNTTARIRFHSWDDAKKVHDSLKTPLKPGYPKFHVWLPKPIQYHVTIPLAQYRAQKGRWDSISERDDNKAAFVRTAVDNNKDVAFIHVLGDDKKAVGQLKVRVENLVLGETLDASLWHRSFLSAAGRRFLEGISTQTNTYVRGDWKTKSLKLCADGRAKEVVLGLIEAEVERLKNSETSITISPRAVGFFLRKGVPTLKEELGDDAVTFELTSPPKLLIRGGEEAHRIVDRLVAESKTGYRLNAGNGEGTCPVCFDDATTPVSLACKHVYCSECIRHYLMSASERKQFPLACAGDEDRCKVPIAIPTIQRFLSQHQFDQLLDAAVTSYIEKQPAVFQYCKTPDCTQVYRRDRGRKMLTCPSCFTGVCTGCNKEAHEGMTCEERKLMNDPEEQERRNEQWAMSAGAKRCPSCSVFMQKTDGCNHMECHCGAHFCWICLQVFHESGAVYEHMNRAHGGIYTADVQQEQRAVEQVNLLLVQRRQQEAVERQRAQQQQQQQQQQQEALRQRQQVLINAMDAQRERLERERTDLLFAQRLQREENELAGVNVANLTGNRQYFDEIWRTQQALRVQQVEGERERIQRAEARRAEEIRQRMQAIAQARAQEREEEQRRQERRSGWCVIM